MVAQVLQPALKVLEIQIREGRGLRLFMPSLVHRGTGLRSLCIVDGNVQQQTIDWKKATFSTSNVAWVLRELTLVNVTLQGAFTALLRLIPFDGIKKLALLKCEGSNTFLKDMAAHYTGKKHGLRHLSVDLSDDQERDHDTLKAIYKICQDLQSLHLEWCGGPIDKDDEDSDYWPHYLDKEVGTLGESLTTLSVHTHVDIRYSDPEDEYDVSDIAKICMSCPKIRQIAFQHDMAIGTHDLMVSRYSHQHWQLITTKPHHRYYSALCPILKFYISDMISSIPMKDTALETLASSKNASAFLCSTSSTKSSNTPMTDPTVQSCRPSSTARSLPLTDKPLQGVDDFVLSKANKQMYQAGPCKSVFLCRFTT